MPGKGRDAGGGRLQGILAVQNEAKDELATGRIPYTPPVLDEVYTHLLCISSEKMGTFEAGGVLGQVRNRLNP